MGTVVDEAEFQFSWINQMIDGKPMEIMKQIGNITSMYFEQFTFISPVYDVFDDLHCNIQTHYDIKDTNYWLIVGVAIVIVILCKSNSLARRAVALFLKKEERELFNQTAELVEGILTSDDPLSLETTKNDMTRE